MITITFIRHGESEDNLRSVWAGWKDAPLSRLGVRQARALGLSFSTTHIDYIYTSTSQRAYYTGKAVLEAQNPKPPFIPLPNLREQHFGIAEGHPWILQSPSNLSEAECYEQGLFPIPRGRTAKIPQGESLDDLANRAEEALRECVLPHITEDNIHIAVASHGLCISELIAALLRLDPESRRDISYSGLLNTAWTRVVVSIKDGHIGPIDVNNPPPLTVRVTDVNRIDHLAEVVVTDEVPNEEQSEARTFFGGGGTHLSNVSSANRSE